MPGTVLCTLRLIFLLRLDGDIVMVFFQYYQLTVLDIINDSGVV